MQERDKSADSAGWVGWGPAMAFSAFTVGIGGYKDKLED